MTDTPEVVSARAESLVEDHEQLLAKLTKHRRDHALSQETVAERMGVSQPTVAKFERYDSNPTLSTIRRYALAVGARIETRIVDDCVPTASSTAHAVDAIFEKKATSARWGTPARQPHGEVTAWGLIDFEVSNVK